MRHGPEGPGLEDADLGEPLLLLGTCNAWGKDLEAARARFSFGAPARPAAPAGGRRESRLELRVEERKVSFQIVSAARLWDWRLHPSGEGRRAKELQCQQRLPAGLARDREAKEVHGRNFHLREPTGACVTIHVCLDRRTGIELWYTRGGQDFAAPGAPLEQRGLAQAQMHRHCFETVDDWRPLRDIEPLRIVGSFCRWRADADGLTLTSHGAADAGRRWHEHRLCFRMRSNQVKFQILSDKLGFDWRLYPRRSRRRGVLGDTEETATSAAVGCQGDGRGRCFKLREAFLTVVTLYVRIEAVRSDWADDAPRGGESGPRSGPTAGSVLVWYRAEDTGLQVALGRRELQCPPEPVSRLDRTVLEILTNPEARRRFLVLQQNLPLVRALHGLVEQHASVPLLRLAPGGESRPPARAALMLMLRPSTLLDGLRVFRTYLRYHLLAPGGPRFAHAFVFVDEADADEGAGGPAEGEQGEEPEPEREQEQEQEQEEEDDPLARWLESADAAELSPLVTLLDGGGLAAASVPPGRRPGELDAKVRAAAAAGELVAKQMLNMERCLALAEARGLDWLLCNLDADEALACAGVGELLAAAPAEVWQLQFLNHEAALEAAEPPADFFLGCTLFKRSPLQLGEAPPEEQRQCMGFWGTRSAAAAAAAEEAAGPAQGAAPLRASEGYFTGYFAGKYAVRVAACCESGAYPEDARCWSVPPAAVARVDPEDACVLHYHNCQGAGGLARKYRARAEERWNNTKFHGLCQRLYSAGDDALEALLRGGLVLTEDDREEVARQLRAGVLLRVTSVRDACDGFDALAHPGPRE